MKKELQITPEYRLTSDDHCWALARRVKPKKKNAKAGYSPVGYYSTLEQALSALAERVARDHFPDLERIGKELENLKEFINENLAT